MFGNKSLDSFEFDKIYHIYTHANDLLFTNAGNYDYFLQKLKEYILPIGDLFAYCLMPNHFHLLIKFKDKPTEAKGLLDLNEHKVIMQKFSNFLNAYAKAFNKQNARRGALFVDYIKRKRIDDEKYLLKVLHYIHMNPINHGFVSDIQKWKYSSYNSYLNLEKESSVHREFIVAFFENKESFVRFHKSIIEYPELEF